MKIPFFLFGVIICLSNCQNLFAQVKPFSTPSFSTPEAIEEDRSPGHYHYSGFMLPQLGDFSQDNRVMTAQDVINQTNRTMGAYYPNPMDAEGNNRINEQRIRADVARESNFLTSRSHEQILEINAILNDLNKDLNSAGIPYYQQADINSADFKAKTKGYEEARQSMTAMLSGTKKLSVKDAFFLMENAYGNSYLSYSEFNSIIRNSADFIRKWLIQNGYSLSNNEALNYGIQQFMGKDLSITIKSKENKTGGIPKRIKHSPYFYDFDDFKGEKDFRNYFATKCIATGAGQCSSLPAVYLMLAEALGAKAYLSFAPQHSFIKYPNAKGKLMNYEPTSHWTITDKWYQDDMFITAEAKRNGI